MNVRIRRLLQVTDPPGVLSTDQAMTYYLPYVTMIPTTVPPTGTDGFGNPVTGYDEPLIDTLLAVANPQSSPMTATVRVYDTNGVVQTWNGQTAKLINLDGGHSIALTFIHPNPYTDAPQNFSGYGIVECSRPAILWTILGGSGYFPNYWNTLSADIPCYADRQIPEFDNRVLTARTICRFPYGIPYFDDANHTGALSYRSRMILTNFDQISTWAHISFRPGDFYPSSGASITFSKQLNSLRSINIDLYTELLAAGYTPTANREGWLTVEFHQTNVITSAAQAVKAIPYILVANRDTNLFSAGEAFF